MISYCQKKKHKTKATYLKKSIYFEGSWFQKLMGTWHQVGSDDDGATPENLHLVYKHEAEKELTGNIMDILNLKAHLQWTPLTRANSQSFLHSFTYLESTIQIYEPVEAPLNNHTTNFVAEAETSGHH